MTRLRNVIARALRAIDPCYDWGEYTIFRLDRNLPDFLDESEGPGWRFEIQWFGLHLGIVVGRTPPAATPAIIASRVASRQRAIQGEFA